MAKVGFKAKIVTPKGVLGAQLEMYLFQEDEVHIVYCPALDISACGKTEKEAKKNFEQTFELHMEYCINKQSLAQDLKEHGWEVKSSKQKRIKSPSVETLLSTNATLQDIVYNKDYRKVSQAVEIPEFA